MSTLDAETFMAQVSKCHDHQTAQAQTLGNIQGTLDGIKSSLDSGEGTMRLQQQKLEAHETRIVKLESNGIKGAVRWVIGLFVKGN